MTRTPRLLAALYLLLCLTTLAVIIVLRDHASVVNAAVWIRATLVTLAALVTNWLARRGDVRRLRIVTLAQVVAITLIVALPGPFPLWLKLEQIACGLVLLATALTLPRKPRVAAAPDNSA